ncbi:Butirosin biosynthesis protein H, N-terminal [Marininema mesophilum]|uniref:Butirosin biosynthesis protein H, N-terminal n=1 Tax=Marininema mesophilum TaxID=1048340 RepID=A0A1H2QA27_9BACL|nr:BtrH N-terminal domain-containing protein [Marininema mesophilum]SDW03534.1 Butirosin biosynthesis protein H, N-terminal [Marininema mesophilum]
MGEVTAYVDSNKNCFHLVLAAILERNGIHPDYAWNQAGLYYEESENHWKMTPYFESVDNCLRGVKVISEKFSCNDRLLDRLDDLLTRGQNVVVPVDIYELPYSMYYREQHNPHSIEMLRLEDGSYHICDHFFQFIGTLSRSDLKKTLDAYNSHCLPDITFSYLQISENELKLPDIEDATTIIKKNCAIMEGVLLDGMESLGSGIYGFGVIVRLIKKLDEMLSLEESAAKDLMEEMYCDIKEVAYSRDNYSAFLKRMGLGQLTSPVEEAAQCWRAASNMLLRAKVAGNHEGMKPRIFKRLERVQEQERLVVEQMENFLSVKGK